MMATLIPRRAAKVRAAAGTLTITLSRLSTAAGGPSKKYDDDDPTTGSKPHAVPDSTSSQRVWRSASSSEGKSPVGSAASWSSTVDGDMSEGGAVPQEFWSTLERIGAQERQSGRMRQNHLGVLREDPTEDMRLLMDNFTVPALASALREREDALQYCASLLERGQLRELGDVLRPYEAKYVKMRRRKENLLDLRPSGFAEKTIQERIRRALMRMPRRVSAAFDRRAAVVLPLCNVGGVPAVLFEKRAPHLRAHPDEVCLPGGMVSAGDDKSIVETCLREMEEEIGGIPHDAIRVLGVLRCNWGEVHHLTGVAVTPVVCYIGEVSDLDLRPSPDEVAECFTVPLGSFLERDRWVHREGFAPIFTGGPHPIWGLTGYVLNRFVKDVLARFSIEVPDNSDHSHKS